MKKIIISCPISATMSILGGKWKSVILWYLKDGPKRFTELKKLISQCSLKMFSDHLKELESDGIIKREVFAQVPPRVEYSITEYGMTLLPIVLEMREWGVKHLINNPELMADNKPLRDIIEMVVRKEN
jgi:DNA-binding HxlR family transcriptional regulator